MKISPISNIPEFGKIVDLNSKNVPPDNRAENATDTFVPTNNVNKKVVTYNKQMVRSDQTTIAGLKEESERAYESLKRIVIELLERQGYSAEYLKNEGLETLEIDETASAEAAALIADDGPLGAEAVSNRIVDFAKAISGGDKSRLPELRGAIEKGFDQVKSMLGGLPEVSLRTYDMVMEKLDNWEKEE